MRRGVDGRAGRRGRHAIDVDNFVDTKKARTCENSDERARGARTARDSVPATRMRIFRSGAYVVGSKQLTVTVFLFLFVPFERHRLSSGNRRASKLRNDAVKKAKKFLRAVCSGSAQRDSHLRHCTRIATADTSTSSPVIGPGGRYQCAAVCLPG